MNHLLFPGSEGCLGDDDNALLLWGLRREKEQYERGHWVVPGKQCVTNLSRNRDTRLWIYLYPFFVTNCHKISSEKTDHRMNLSLISWLSFGNFHSCNLHQIQSRFYFPLDQWLVFNRLAICPSSVISNYFQPRNYEEFTSGMMVDRLRDSSVISTVDGVTGTGEVVVVDVSGKTFNRMTDYRRWVKILFTITIFDFSVHNAINQAWKTSDYTFNWEAV